MYCPMAITAYVSAHISAKVKIRTNQWMVDPPKPPGDAFQAMRKDTDKQKLGLYNSVATWITVCVCEKCVTGLAVQLGYRKGGSDLKRHRNAGFFLSCVQRIAMECIKSTERKTEWA